MPGAVLSSEDVTVGKKQPQGGSILVGKADKINRQNT